MRHLIPPKDLLAQLPDGFVPYQQWPEFDLLNYTLPHLEATEIDSTPRGIRSGRWQIYFEEYVSDTEPIPRPDPKAPPRLLVWRRIGRSDTPKGWWQLGWRFSRLEGIASLTTASYTTTWSESARRYRHKWLSENAVIELVPLSAFLDGYRQSDLPVWVRDNYSSIATRMQRGPKAEFLETWGAKDATTGQLLGGMVVINSSSCKSSYYLCGFVASDAKDRSVMVGLIDHWFAISQKRNYRFLHFGEFWLPGKPQHWKGFSKFKSKFGLSYLWYPPPLVRPKSGTLQL